MNFEVLIVEQAAAWHEVIAAMPEQDVHFTHGYAAAVSPDHARLAVASFSWGVRVVKPFELRPIPGVPGYFDVASLRGYGGPVVQGLARQTAATAFDVAFVEWCRAQSVVSEFCVYHPLLRDVQAVAPQASRGKRVVILDVDQPADHLLATMRRDRRHNINAAMRAGATVEIVPPTLENAQTFQALYDATMDRVGAAARWRLKFEDTASLFACMPKGEALFAFGSFNGAVETASIILTKGRVAYYYLTGNARQRPDVSVNDLLIFEVARWLRGKAELFHLGGGVTDREDDSLWLYKASFGGCQYPIETSFRVFDHEMNDRLCDFARARLGHRYDESRFVPAYRRDVA